MLYILSACSFTGALGQASILRNWLVPRAAQNASPDRKRKEMHAMTDCFIYDAVRTPRGKGKKDGSLHEVTALELTTQTLRAIRERNSLDTAELDDVIIGCVDPVGEQGADIARAAVLKAGYEQNVPGVQINRFCASGLEACNMAAGQIMAGQSDLAIGGGVEAMSRVAIGSSGGAWPEDPSIAFPAYFVPQGISADLIATLDGFSRDDVDAFAVESQKRAAMAWSKGYFENSVIQVKDATGQTILGRDEHMRPETTMQSLASLKPAFADFGAMGFDAVAIQRYPQVEALNHVHHAGNSSGIVDGAAAVLMGTKEEGAALGLKPRARVKAYASIGSEPCIMLTAPADVTKKVLKRAKMEARDIDLYEINEAFASVVLRFLNVMKLDLGKVNVNGGAIAMGHPLGATGAMLLGMLLDEMERRKASTGLVTLCIGAGMGTATIIERV
jgi:acetyl-CoA C-acetyltransferase